MCFVFGDFCMFSFSAFQRVQTNRVGAWGLVPHATSHTTVHAVRHTAVPLSPVPSYLIKVHIIFRKCRIACLSQTFVRHRFMYRGVC